MTQSLAIPRVIPNDWKRLDLIINKIKFHLGSASSPTFTGVTITGLTASSLVGTDASKKLESVTIGTGLAYARPTLSLSHLGIESLTDPGTDKILFWDDSESACGWLGVGNSIAITGTTVDTIQDIRTSASPSFAGLTITGTAIPSLYVNGGDLWLQTADGGQINFRRGDMNNWAITNDKTTDDFVIYSYDLPGNVIVVDNASGATTAIDLTLSAPVNIYALSHDSFADFAAGEHFLQTTITNVSTALSTGLLKVTTGTGALSVVADSSTDWDAAYTHVSNNGTDHSYIDQDLTTSATPTFNRLIFSGITATNMPYMHADGFYDSPLSRTGPSNVTLSYAGANSDIQIRFTRSDGAGDPTMYFTYWGQSDYNTLGVTNGSIVGIQVDTQGHVLVCDATSLPFAGEAAFAVLNGFAGIGEINPKYELDVAGGIGIQEKSSDPAEPREGCSVMWMSDGTGYGDDGDICAASKAGGATKKAILFDYSAGDAW